LLVTCLRYYLATVTRRLSLSALVNKRHPF
jgi:hypothetical protein